MKGLMVTLLILSCTGMVLAQQSNNSGFRTNGESSDASSFRDRSGGGEAPVVPIVNGEGSAASQSRSTRGTGSTAIGSQERARNSFDPNRNRSSTSSSGTQLRFGTVGSGGSILSGGSAASARRTDSMTSPAAEKDVVYLGLPGSAIADLKKFGSVAAAIEDPWVEKITISDRNEPKNAPKVEIVPEVRGDDRDTLVFRFTEEHLAHIDEYAFEFKVPDRLKGYVKKAIIEYPPALQGVRSPQTAPLGPRFESDDNRWRLAGDTTQGRTPVRNDAWQDQSTGTGLTDLDRQRELARLNRQRELELIERQREEDQRLAYEKMLQEKEAKERLQFTDQNRLLKENLQLQAQLEAFRLSQQQSLARAQQGLYPQGRVADKTYLVGQPLPVTRPVMQQPAAQTTSGDSLAVTMMQNHQMQLQRVEDRMAQLNADNESMRRKLFDINNNSRRTDLVDHQIERRDRTDEINSDYPDRPVMSTAGLNNMDRRADAPNGGLKGKEAGVAKTSNPNDQGWKLLMFIMLLCSVGLNVYLWAIARGSYMRYEELAHELRETFTVTA